MGIQIGLFPSQGLSDKARRTVRFSLAAALLAGVTLLYMKLGPTGSVNAKLVQGVMVFWLMGLLILTMLSIVDPKWEVKLRNVRYVAIIAYCLVVKGGFLDGRAGWHYAFQRLIAEAILSLRLLEHRLGEPGS